MEEPGEDEQRRPGRDVEAAESTGADRLAAERVCRRIEPHRFLDGALDGRQSGEIRDAGHSPTQHPACLVGDAVGDLRMAREEPPGPGQRQRGRLVARQQQRDHLVADLPVGHRAAVLVTRLEQRRQEVVAARSTRPVLGHDPGDERVHPRHRAAIAEVSRHGEAVGNREGPADPPGDFLDADVECIGDLRDVGGHLCVEQDLGHDLEGERGHLQAYVDDGAVPPPRHATRGSLHHDVPVRRQSIMTERGLDEPPLAEPGIALVGQEPPAEDRLHVAPEEPVLDEVVGPGNEHLFDQRRVVDEERGAGAQAKPYDVAVLPRAPLDEPEGVARELREVADQGSARGTGWKAQGAPARHASMLSGERARRQTGPARLWPGSDRGG